MMCPCEAVDYWMVTLCLNGEVQNSNTAVNICNFMLQKHHRDAGQDWARNPGTRHAANPRQVRLVAKSKLSGLSVKTAICCETNFAFCCSSKSSECAGSVWGSVWCLKLRNTRTWCAAQNVRADLLAGSHGKEHKDCELAQTIALDIWRKCLSNTISKQKTNSSFIMQLADHLSAQ